MLIRLLLDFCFPPRCLACKKIVGSADGLCPTCFGKIFFITAPLCNKCGHPFEFHGAEENNTCLSCKHNPPPWTKMIAVTIYDDFSRKLILPLKYSDDTGLARFLGLVMACAGWEMIKEHDVLIPIPLGRKRLFFRLYNQSSLLAKIIGRITDKAVDTSTLKRKGRKTDGARGLSKTERAQNVKGAFHVTNPKMIKGRNIVLIDDVFTTGATFAECTRVLKRAGARSVSCLAFAKTSPQKNHTP